MWASSRTPATADSVLDVPYIEAMFNEMNPNLFSLISVLNGQPPLDRSRRLVWAEIGCGNGTSACMVAAANPDIDVWGMDYSPAHIERARSFAAAAGLGNCTFDEATFEEMVNDPTLGPAEVDVITLHGVYSWVSKRDAQQIAEFIRRRLRPGGIVYVSYNVSTGWAGIGPLAEAMRLHVVAGERTPDVAMPDAVAAIGRLQEAEARYFPVGPREMHRIEQWSTLDVRYGAHEYLVENFRPVMFAEVAEVMGMAKCTFLGGIEAHAFSIGNCLPPDLRAVALSTPDVAVQQMVIDLSIQRGFRMDLFRKGHWAVTAATTGWFEEIRLVGLDKQLADGNKVRLLAGDATLLKDFYGPLLHALSEKSLTVRELRGLMPDAQQSEMPMVVSMLVDGGYAAPESPGWERSGARDSARGLNTAIVAEARRGISHTHLVSPATGSCVRMELVRMLTLGAVWDGVSREAEALVDHMLGTFRAIGFLVREDGELVEDADRARTIVRARVTQSLELWPLWERLGLC